MDLFKIDKKSVLHVLDVGTRFSAAAFIDDVEGSKSVRDAFLEFWVLLYAGMPDNVSVDQGSAFTSIDWKKLSDENEVFLNVKVSDTIMGYRSAKGTMLLCEPYTEKPVRSVQR